jgi:2-polyprenyl-3-methyl-5-hydroxy-6-metoxy-1,4-benzoquinol methylase
MRYIYNAKSLPPIGPELLKRLDAAATRLAKKLADTNIAQLPLSDYGKENVAEFQHKAGETIKKYVHILAWLLFPETVQLPEIFVDYGGGHGLLGGLAKEAGFPNVVYNDIFSGCAEDARKLARHLGCEADCYVVGDIHAVAAALKANPPASGAVASINVIEHIYDMDDFLKTASGLTRGPMTMVLSTSANPLNPSVARRHYRQHREWEFTDGPHESSYPMDTLRAFRDVRSEIIKEAAPGLAGVHVETLTARTRGMHKADIQKAVKSFQATKQLPPAPKHPTNTCDPLTGSWQERLLDIGDLRTTLGSCGFGIRVMGGYYAAHDGGAVKKVVARLLNHGISLLGPQGARLAPCIMFHAARR